jgi:hypothetical protein
LTQQIAKRAYELYGERAGNDGTAVQDWKKAEQEIRNDEVQKLSLCQRPKLNSRKPKKKLAKTTPVKLRLTHLRLKPKLMSRSLRPRPMHLSLKARLMNPSPEPRLTSRSLKPKTRQPDVSPQLVKRVHELYEQLGREDVQAVQELGERIGRNRIQHDTNNEAGMTEKPNSRINSKDFRVPPDKKSRREFEGDVQSGRKVRG